MCCQMACQGSLCSPQWKNLSEAETGDQVEEFEISAGRVLGFPAAGPVYGNNYCDIVSSKITPCTSLILHDKLDRNVLKIWKINVV